MARVNIVKRIKIGGRWKMFSIPQTPKATTTGTPRRRSLLCRVVRGRHSPSCGAGVTAAQARSTAA